MIIKLVLLWTILITLLSAYPGFCHNATFATTCTEVQEFLLGRRACVPDDGEYLLNMTSYFPEATAPVIRSVYCHGMNTSDPKPYLTLPAGPEANYAHVAEERTSGSGSDGCAYNGNFRINRHSGKTKFNKVGLSLGAEITIVRNDYTFATTTGIRTITYGSAGDCRDGTYNNAQGDFSIDLTNTGFKVHDQVAWQLYNWMPEILDFTTSITREKVSARCGGFKGFCYPRMDGVTKIVLSLLDNWNYDDAVFDAKTVDVTDNNIIVTSFRRNVTSLADESGCTKKTRSKIECAAVCHTNPFCKQFNYEPLNKLCHLGGAEGWTET